MSVTDAAMIREARLLAEKWKRSSDGRERMLGADLAQLLDREESVGAGVFDAPAKLDRTRAIAVLDDIRSGMLTGDSFEGFFEYSWEVDDGPNPNADVWLVRARYRVGNLHGQGGVSVVKGDV